MVLCISCVGASSVIFSSRIDDFAWGKVRHSVARYDDPNNLNKVKRSIEEKRHNASVFMMPVRYGSL